MDETVEKAKALRRTPTRAEARLWARLRKKRLSGHKFRRQHPLLGYVVDFCCLAGRLVVESTGPCTEPDPNNSVTGGGRKPWSATATRWSGFRARLCSRGSAWRWG